MDHPGDSVPGVQAVSEPQAVVAGEPAAVSAAAGAVAGAGGGGADDAGGGFGAGPRVVGACPARRLLANRQPDPRPQSVPVSRAVSKARWRQPFERRMAELTMIRQPKKFRRLRRGGQTDESKERKRGKEKGAEGSKVFSPRQPDTAAAEGDRGRPVVAVSGPAVVGDDDARTATHHTGHNRGSRAL